MFKYILLFFASFLFAQKPQLLLLNNYHDDANLSNWVMSEKLDGVRAYWDGQRLVSRSGNIFAAPKFFTQEFPPFALDGELWSRRGDFSNIVSIVTKETPHEGWRALHYHIFEVPESEGNLSVRLQRLANYLETHDASSIKIVKQLRVSSHDAVQRFLKEVEAKGGEGVVIRDGSLPYHTGRSSAALKVKSF